jgi:ABC-type multidrug transport system fused ATPase/permease subunit
MRATIDKLVSWTGLILAIVLLVAGGLLTYASVFIGNQVHDQLAAQHVTMPTTQTGLSDLPKADQAALAPYAGKTLTTGAQAKAYADHYIAVHLQGIGGGKTYSEVSGQYIQQCTSDPKVAATKVCTDLASARQSMFMGETLRGLLLYGYAFATMGVIAGYAALASFVGSALLFVLAGFGFWHSRKAAQDATPESQPAGAHV